MKYAIVVFCGLALAGCVAVDRHAALEDLGDHYGVQSYPDGEIYKLPDGTPELDGRPDYKPEEVAIKVAGEAATHGGDPVGLAIYLALGAGAVGIGLLKRKVLGQALVKILGSAGAAVVEKELEGKPKE
jgi:hypothetical protein